MASLGIDIGGTSVKACLLEDGQALTVRSSVYNNPSRESLIEAIHEVISLIDVDLCSSISIGLCLPGRRSERQDSIEISVNMPCLNGWAFKDLLSDALGYEPTSTTVVSDVQAAGEDFLRTHACTGRSAIIAIGTGVGLAVFDGCEPVGVGRRGIGHLGMMDVGRLGDEDTVGVDGSKNTLESYIGARSIERRFHGLDPTQIPGAIGTLGMDEPIMAAVVRMIRVVHAIYIPDQVILMGGVGIALQPRGVELRSTSCDGLTSLANSDWKLLFGDSAFHAARGAASRAGL